MIMPLHEDVMGLYWKRDPDYFPVKDKQATITVACFVFRAQVFRAQVFRAQHYRHGLP